MAIYIPGRTACRLCGATIAASAELVGLPHLTLPPDLQDLADGCFHRRCLDAHPRRPDFVQAWQAHWRQQAAVPGMHAAVSPHGVVMFYGKRLAYAASGSFVTLEERADAFDALREFFTGFDGRRPAALAAPFHAYAATPLHDGVRLTVTSNPPPPGVLRVSNDPLVLSAECTHARWGSLARGWAQFTRP